VTPANFDFHCHSIVSDGFLPPQDVARRAAANGVDLWALTDHDDIGGLVQAKATAEEVGMRFVNGVEISIEWRGIPIHIVGLGFDAANSALTGGRKNYARVVSSAPGAWATLAAIGIPGV
jgi:predicted metal-dependent phosphoesterase TrpH